MVVMEERERTRAHVGSEPDVSESYFKTVEAPQALVEGVAARLDLAERIGPLLATLPHPEQVALARVLPRLEAALDGTPPPRRPPPPRSPPPPH